MNKSLDPGLLQFYRTRSTPCPYLGGREERLVFTHLDEGDSGLAHDVLARAGFRRSHDIAYRPDCDGCRACRPVRIRIEDVVPTRSMKRVLNRNRGLTRTILPPLANREHFGLFSRYQQRRHGGGAMVEMDFDEYRSMIERTPVETLLVEYRDDDGVLTGASLTDRIEDGLSMVYSFYEPEPARRSGGTFIILDHVRLARSWGLEYVYLGYAVEGCPNMAYKTQFQPVEVFGPEGWDLAPRTGTAG